MYANTYYSLFPPFPRKDTVFVAMSFDSQFQKRWKDVIEKGINNVAVNGNRLEAIRVDAGRISDSILTEILSGIGTSRLFLADITTIGYQGEKREPIRNANVMYEVGIAHAARLAEEVLLFRSDNDRLLFDVANMRVNKYSPDEKPDEATQLITDCIISALRELDLRRSLAVARALESLDAPSWWALSEAQSKEVEHPVMRTMRESLGNAPRAAAIQRLLDLGAIRASYLSITPEIYESLKDKPAGANDLLKYQSTAFGTALFVEGARRMGLGSPEMMAILEKQFQKNAEQSTHQ